MSSSPTAPERSQTVIEVKKILFDEGDISYIAIELIKHTDILHLILRKYRGGSFWMIAEKLINRGSITICINNFPPYRDIDYTNRVIIRWICNNADLLINKF